MTGARSHILDGSPDVDRIWRLHVGVRGTVQGVGFRPFVYRLATELDLAGWVRNSPEGVQIELEGNSDKLRQFTDRLTQEKPVLSHIDSLESTRYPPAGYSDFAVKESVHLGEIEAVILPDIATCEECRREVFDPSNRRYRYPFTNCTNCGPRYSIIEALPYDRVNTTMKQFVMCEECRQEYEDPSNRRFHAQPNACPNCGPRLQLWDNSGTRLAEADDALVQACRLVCRGGILALKGLGGFQLVVDAGNDEAVRRLRNRKARPEKPLALMYADLGAAGTDCELAKCEIVTLTSTASPIVLLRRKSCVRSDHHSISGLVAPDNPYLGVMLPYTPLHYLLMAELDGPVVATSGNRSDESICTDEHEALDRLGRIADLFLVHDRPIAQHTDDSIVRVMADRPVVLRSARGYAPTAVDLPRPVSDCLAVGGHQKNTVCLAKNRRALISQHVGDLGSKSACDTLRKVVGSLLAVCDVVPREVACDLHPDYQSTRFASSFDAPRHMVQHHYAHILSCMAENHLEPPLLGVAFDGAGLGSDGTVWGGEFLMITGDNFERVAHLRQFRLPGGDAAAREPRRAALGLMWEIFGEATFDMVNLDTIASFTSEERRVLRTMLRKGVNAPITSSAGRLFDGVSSLLGLCQVMSFEGQAAMQLEFVAETAQSADPYPFGLKTQGAPYVLDWEPMLREIMADLSGTVAPQIIAARFHCTLAKMIADVATRIGVSAVALTGGCFQNRYFTERVLARLQRSDIEVFMPERVPPNDGGLALGQIMAACSLRSEGN